MKKIVTTVYSFDELNDEAKQKAIETERHNELRLNYNWWDGVFDDFREQFKEIGIDNADFEFSLEYYAKLTEGTCNIKKILPKLRFGLENHIYVLLVNGDICVDSTIYAEEYKYIGNYLKKAAENLEKELNDKIEELNKKLYKALQEEYEYLQSDEVIAKEFKDNESLFYEDGTLYQY